MIPEFVPAKYRKPVRLAQLHYGDDEIARAPQQVLEVEAPLIIGPLADPIYVYLREHFASRAHFVRWEDFRETWDYRVRDGRLQLVVDGRPYPVRSVYVRSCEVTDEYEHIEDLHTLMSVLSSLRQKRLGTIDLGISNFSKIMQLQKIVRAAAQGLPTMAVPETCMIKSAALHGADLAKLMGSSVAKSISSARTQVFDDRVFRHFRRHRPALAPVLIQKKISGLEIRVHSLLGRAFPLGIKKLSDRVDYRYDCEVELQHDIQLTEDELAFCRRVHALDRNPWIGLDLIRMDGITYCFEANPNPGWACFDYKDDVKREIGETLMSYLEAP